jgi:RimJ/RimL family protein N-acetyltransferase
MPVTNLRQQLRPATLDDAEIVADLDSTRDPTEPRDPVLLRYWWQMGDELEHVRRWVAMRDGAAVAFLGASHQPWADSEKRFGVIRPVLRSDGWNDAEFVELVALGESWLRSEGAQIAIARIREDLQREVAVLERLGYREDRRMRTSELDLVARRQHILESAERCRLEMERQGVALHPIAEDPDPKKLEKLQAVMVESEKDIPRSVPWPELTFEQWRHYWFDNPAIREDRFWIAREGESIVGCSVLDSPVVRGIPWTAYTGTLRRVRGRGIARALKYQSMAQAIEAGYTRVRTNNDADNPPILRVNAEMGYRLVAPVLEMHRSLA